MVVPMPVHGMKLDYIGTSVQPSVWIWGQLCSLTALGNPVRRTGKLMGNANFDVAC